MMLRSSARLVLGCWLAAGVGSAQAQLDDPFDPTVLPVEDLQGRFHLSEEDIVDILSTRSLMLSDSDATLIEDAKRRAAERDEELSAFVALNAGAVEVEALDVRDLRLDAILFVSLQQWTVWLNGEPVTPDATPQGIRIARVTPQLVEIVWQPDPGDATDVRAFTLQTGQIYVSETRTVMEADEYGALSDALASDGASGGTDDMEDASTDAVGDDSSGDMTLNEEQRDLIAQLQQALSVISGNAGALGMTEDELAALQESLAESGDVGSLTPEQQAQLQRIQQATGMQQ